MIKKLGNIIMVQLSDIDSNIYLIGDVAIDAGTGFNFTRLRDFLRIAKLSLADIKLVVNTHCHYDHVGGNGFFVNAKVAIHKDDAVVLEKGDNELAVAEYFDGKMKPRKVDQLLKEGDVIKAGGTELQVLHTPGHTAGSICLYDKKGKALFTGDTLFENGVGRTDFPNSDPELLEKSLERILKLPIERVYPGHGNPFDKKTLQQVLKSQADPDELPV